MNSNENSISNKESKGIGLIIFDHSVKGVDRRWVADCKQYPDVDVAQDIPSLPWP